MTAMPFVSCIMPTRNRPGMAARAVRCFLAQDYPSRELVILDDGPAASAPAVADDRVRYLHDRPSKSLGEKRNRAIERSKGDVIVHWDDDDWCAATRLSYQVRELLASGRDACGIDRLLYYDSRSRRAWLYRYPPASRPWAAGGSLCYWRTAWARRRFPAVTRGEDTQFIWSAPPLSLLVHGEFLFYVALIHGANTCEKPLTGPCWTPWQGPQPREVMGADWEDL